MPHVDPVARKEWERTYRKKNREKISAYQKAWKAANKEHIDAERKRWAEENPEKAAAQVARKKARWQKKRYRCETIEQRKKRIFNRAKMGAKKRGLEFSISLSDIDCPDVCPVLGIKLNWGAPSNGRRSIDSPSIDRWDSSLGYVPGNVVVMSWRANRIKCDATVYEVEKLLSYMRRKAIH